MDRWIEGSMDGWMDYIDGNRYMYIYVDEHMDRGMDR